MIDPSATVVPEGAPGVADTVIDLHEEGSIGLHIVETEAAGRVELAPASTGLLSARRWQLVVKRLVDVVGSIVLLLLLLPIWAVTVIAIGMSSRGSALYAQERIGRDGKPFKMLKFRSMRVGAHEGREAVMHLNQATGPTFKINDDPRITRVGRLIRKWSIDELPQLINVVLGDMSLVGPRPPLPDEYETYDARERGRLAVTPGVTCIWQISGRSDLDFETWVAMDLEYIETWNVRKDFEILLGTIPAVLSARGAY